MPEIADKGPAEGPTSVRGEHAREPEGAPAPEAAADDGPSPARDERPVEVGGRGGLDPTRYGDWEKGGRCIDF